MESVHLGMPKVELSDAPSELPFHLKEKITKLNSVHTVTNVHEIVEMSRIDQLSIESERC